MGYSQLYINFMNKYNRLKTELMQIESMQIEIVPESATSITESVHDISEGH